MSKATAVYRRVSTDKQTQEMQIHAIKKWLEDNPDETLQHYEDTASGKSMKRTAMQSLIRAIEAGQIKKLVFWRLSRLGRRTIDVLTLLDLCVKHGVQLESIADKVDLSSAFGRAMVQVMAVFDELQRQIISENTKEGIAAARIKNKDNPDWKIGGSKYKNWFSQKTRDLAPSIMKLHNEGLGWKRISKRLKVSKNTILKVIRLKGIIPENQIRDAS